MMEYILLAPVASAIFAITVLTSVLAFSNENIYSGFILQPYAVYRHSRTYTVLTSGLIHADWMHLFFNMITYYFFAFRLEPALGHWQFAFLYIVSLILSDLPTVYKHRNDEWYHSLGASGAVSAVIFSSIMFHPIDNIYLMFIPFGVPAVLFGFLYLIYCSYASRVSRDNINHDAHLFGAISGLFITVILKPGILSDFITQISVEVQSLLHH